MFSTSDQKPPSITISQVLIGAYRCKCGFEKAGNLKNPDLMNNFIVDLKYNLNPDIIFNFKCSSFIHFLQCHCTLCSIHMLFSLSFPFVKSLTCKKKENMKTNKIFSFTGPKELSMNVFLDNAKSITMSDLT